MIEKRKERKNMKKIPVVNKERYEKVQEKIITFGNLSTITNGFYMNSIK